MPDLPYTFMPLYGHEPYLSNGGAGGSRVTQDNLVISSWSVTKKFGEPPEYMEFGTILHPAEVNTSLGATDRVAGKQTANSRYSALAYLQDVDDPLPLGILGFVLNPPAEMKQLLQGALSYNGGDVNNLANYTVHKSLQSAYLWRGLHSSDGLGHNVVEINFANLPVFSTYLWFGDLATDANVHVPFLKTNGANGVAPVFFNPTTPAGVTEMIDAVNSGDFYVIYTMFVTDDEATYYGTYYPHSTARG
jgi:hypothetical protein